MYATEPSTASFSSPLPERRYGRTSPPVNPSKFNFPFTMIAEDFEDVLKGKYPSMDHNKNVLDLIRKEVSETNGIFYLESRRTRLLDNTDEPEPFRQCRYFYYLTGCNLADCYFIFDTRSAKSTLFIPPIDPDEVIWSGLPLSPKEALARYEVDEVAYSTGINAALSSYALANPHPMIFAIDGKISDDVNLSDFTHKNLTALKKAIEVSRIVKDEFEVAMIRKANHISSIAHEAAMQKSRKASNEQELLATFLESAISSGATCLAYHPIFGAGAAAATLHYMDNNAPLKGKMNVLIDAGAEWGNYASDITRTFPLNGRFTPESRAIYDIVYKMQKDALAQIRAEANWDFIHVVAHKAAINGLLGIGILRGDAQEIFEARTSVAFFPHGLGHHLGLDTHDTGGGSKRAETDLLFRYLRLRGTFPAGSVLAVEPGIYFCRFIIDPYLKDPKHSKFIDAKLLGKYWEVGGVRIEDNVLVTETGYEILTAVCKEPRELEAMVLGG